MLQNITYYNKQLVLVANSVREAFIVNVIVLNKKIIKSKPCIS